MHRTEASNNAANLFTNGPPGTDIEENWLNAVQEEIANAITGAGLALKTAATDTRDQLRAAILASNSTAFLVEHLTNGAHSNITAENIFLDDGLATDDVINVFITGDPGLSFNVLANGNHQWADGNNPVDTTLARSGVGTLQIGDNLDVVTAITTGTIDATTTITGEKLLLDDGLAADLVTDIRVTGDSFPRLTIRADGIVAWSDGTGVTDTSIARTGVARLAVTSNLDITNDLGVGGAINGEDINLDDGLAADNVIRVSVTGDAGSRYRVQADGEQGWADGTNPVDIVLGRSGAGQLTTDGLFIAEGGFQTLTGQFYQQPDVSGGGANDGNFLGGNGGFMWFDGVTNGTTPVVLDSTLDWRDRWIFVIGYTEFHTTPANFVPGGSSDTALYGWLEQIASSVAQMVGLPIACLYSEAGAASAGAAPLGLIGLNGEDPLYLYADSSSGELRLSKSSDSGDEAAFGYIVLFSGDQGHY